jgi:type III pantothenate kinase
VILALDVGNSHVFGGIFEDGRLQLQFRRTSRPSAASDELGVFLRGVVRENGHDPSRINQIAICSVVPEMLYSLRSCCRKYFAVDPFILQAGARTGLKIRYRNPAEVGPDRIASAIAAVHLYPNQNLIVIDFGTATTINVVNGSREYLGGTILPGLRIAMEALEKNTARLPTVEISRRTTSSDARPSRHSIGLYFGTREVVAGLTQEMRKAAFASEARWGLGRWLRTPVRTRELFGVLIPDLVLLGLERALDMNAEAADRGPCQAHGDV